MNPKSDPSIDVTLEKSAAGTWTVPETRRLPFKPWQRLWLVTGVLYLLMLAGSCYLLMPAQESIERQLVESVTEEVRRYDGMAFAGDSPQKIREQARSLGHAAWIAQLRSRYRIGAEGHAGFERIEKRYQEALSALPVQQAFGILVCIVAWLVPMCLLYAIGFVAAWIKEGTRSLHG